MYDLVLEDLLWCNLYISTFPLSLDDRLISKCLGHHGLYLMVIKKKIKHCPCSVTDEEGISEISPGTEYGTDLV